MWALHELIRFMNWFCLKGVGYAFWSGIGISFFAPAVWSTVYYRHHNCHVKGCWRPGHIDPEQHGFPACRRHHTKRDILGTNPHEDIGL